MVFNEGDVNNNFVGNDSEDDTAHDELKLAFFFAGNTKEKKQNDQWTLSYCQCTLNELH